MSISCNSLHNYKVNLQLAQKFTTKDTPYIPGEFHHCEPGRTGPGQSLGGRVSPSGR